MMPRWIARLRPEMSRFLMVLVAAAIGLNLLIFAFTAVTMNRARQAADLQARQWTQNLALALEKELEGIIKASDLVLLSVIDEVRRQKTAGIVDHAQLNDHVEPLRQRLPYIDGLRLTDADGILRFGTEVAGGKVIDLSDRDHFKALVAQRDEALVISRLQKSRANDKWVIALARRISAPDGSFDGMAFIPIPVANLTLTFSEIQLPAGASISLRGFNLETIARYEADHRSSIPPVQAEVGKEIAELLARGAVEGTVHDVTPRDGVRRIRSFRRVAEYPLYIVVGRADDEYLDQWQRLRATALVTLAAFVALTLLLSVLVFRYWNKLTLARDTMQRMAHTDFLTGLANRRAFIEAAELELVRAKRYGTPVSLLMMDVDFFKKVNDTRGHEVGDAALKGIAACALGVLREVDLMGRWGGEEFIILLPETDAASAAEAAERLRAAVEKMEVACSGGAIRLTVSIGHASRRNGEEGIDALIRRADDALYRAKETGRNRTRGQEMSDG